MNATNQIIHIAHGPTFSMILVEGGTLNMGSYANEANSWEQPMHKVTIPPFFIGEFPVTQALWKAVMDGQNPSYFKGDQRPVETVSWLDAQAFIKRLNEMIGMKFRLPTESEWEYAALGGIKSERFKYAGSNEIKEVAWYAENSYEETKAVGLKLPNELGIYDMSGNVFEWCEDEWHNSYSTAPQDGSAWVDSHKLGFSRVLRSGCYLLKLESCRSSYRYAFWPEVRNQTFGFRLALSPQFSP